MGFNISLCKKINRLFPLPVHPFNLQNQGLKTYAQWQFEKGRETIRFYLDKVSIEDMFKDKTVLDIGCGAGGKTLYYASQGAKKVYGIDVVSRYENDANKLAREKGLENSFQFVLGDASNLDFNDNFFDVIIINDAVEHVAEPLKVLDECNRVLKSGGRVYLNFPPYYHPFGAHLSDAVGIPWVHMFFSDKTLIPVYKDLVKDLPDGQERIAFRISRDNTGKEYFSYINKMTVKRFNKILGQTDYNVLYHNEVPLRSFMKPLSAMPILKECFVKMVVCILEKK